MNPSPFSKRQFFIAVLIASLVVITSFISGVKDGTRTKIVFCDVGQGDSAYIRIENRYDVVVDTGPDRKILDCLGKYMPFYDRQIELLIISHAQKDHSGALSELAKRYQIKNMVSRKQDQAEISKQLAANSKQLTVGREQINFIIPKSGTKIKIAHANFLFLWPENSSLLSKDENSLSLIFLSELGGHTVLFTGDSNKTILNHIRKKIKDRITILKVPHHGSGNSLDADFLRLADPKYSVISVSRNNAYGHPSYKIINLYKALKKLYFRTDQQGDIVFIVDNNRIYPGK